MNMHPTVRKMDLVDSVDNITLLKLEYFVCTQWNFFFHQEQVDG